VYSIGKCVPCRGLKSEWEQLVQYMSRDCMLAAKWLIIFFYRAGFGWYFSLVFLKWLPMSERAHYSIPYTQVFLSTQIIQNFILRVFFLYSSLEGGYMFDKQLLTRQPGLVGSISGTITDIWITVGPGQKLAKARLTARASTLVKLSISGVNPTNKYIKSVIRLWVQVHSIPFQLQ